MERCIACLKGDQMKRLWLLIFISFIGILFATDSICQVKRQDSQVAQDSKINLSDIRDHLRTYGFKVGIAWEWEISSKRYGNSYQNVEKDLDRWFQNCKKDNLSDNELNKIAISLLEHRNLTPSQKQQKRIEYSGEQINEKTLSEKYETNIRKLFERLQFIGGTRAMFLYDEIPFVFVKKDNKIAVIVVGIGSSIVYNTLITTPKKRAASMTRSAILPLMQVFQNALEDTRIKHYGLVVAYGSKDFVNPEFSGRLEPEVMSFIVSNENCKRFCEGVITDDELVAASEVYLLDRDMHFMRIKVNLE